MVSSVSSAIATGLVLQLPIKRLVLFFFEIYCPHTLCISLGTIALFGSHCFTLFLITSTYKNRISVKIQCGTQKKALPSFFIFQKMWKTNLERSRDISINTFMIRIALREWYHMYGIVCMVSYVDTLRKNLITYEFDEKKAQ